MVFENCEITSYMVYRITSFKKRFQFIFGLSFRVVHAHELSSHFLHVFFFLSTYYVNSGKKGCQQYNKNL